MSLPSRSASVDEVASVISSLGYPELAERLAEDEIDGEALYMLDRSDFEGYGLKKGPAMKLHNKLQDGGPPPEDSPREDKGGKGKKKGKGKKRQRDDDDDHGSKGKGKGGRNGETTATLEFQNDCDPAFNIVGKLLGNRGHNVHYIQDESGSKIHIDDRSFTISITAPDRDSLNRAVEMCNDLIRATTEDYQDWLAENGDSGGGKGKRDGKGKGKDKGKGKGKGKGKDSKGGKEGKDGRRHEVTLTLDRTHRDFRMKGKMVGENGKNVFYIQDQTRAEVRVDQDGEDVRIHITADTKDELDHALQMTKDLVDTVMEDYSAWLDDQGIDDPLDYRDYEDADDRNDGHKGMLIRKG